MIDWTHYEGDRFPVTSYHEYPRNPRRIVKKIRCAGTALHKLPHSALLGRKFVYAGKMDQRGEEDL